MIALEHYRRSKNMRKIKPSTIVTITTLMLFAAAAVPSLGKLLAYLSFD